MDADSDGALNSDFLSYLERLESGGRNIPNTTEGTSSGQAQGYQQITTGTWREFAPVVGVDLGRYPNPLSAPYSVQTAVAQRIPLNRWDPKTLDGLRAAGFRVNPELTLGQNIALNGGGSRAIDGLTAVPAQDVLGDALNPIAAAVAGQAAAGIAPKAPAPLSAPALNALPAQDILGDALGTVPTAQPPQAVTAPLTNAQAGPGGLIWDANGGHDPKTGELVIAGKPFATPVEHPQLLSGAMGVLGGIPIAGPYLQGGVERAAAGYNALRTGTPYGDNLSQIQGDVAEAQRGYPVTSEVGNVIGGVAGMAPVVAAAPEAFGIGTGLGAVPNALIAGSTNAGIGAIDAAVRNGSPTDVGRAAAIGAAGGAGGALLGSGLNALGRSISGGVMAPEDAALATLARDKYGIPLTADQLGTNAGTRFVRSASDRLPFSGAGSDIAETQAAFNRAVAETIGEGGATKLTPPVMNAAKARIGSMFDSVAANTTIKADPQFDEDLLKVVSEAQNSGMTADELRPINKIFDSILDAIDPKTRTLSGEAYQTLTRTNTPFGKALSNSNPNISNVADEIKNALDDALGRSASPEDLQTFQKAKSQWRNMRTIQPIVAKSPTGDVSPALLAGRVNAATGNGMAFGYGGGLGELARIGQRFMKEPPSSGTAERAAALGALGGTAAGGANALIHGALVPGAYSLGAIPTALAVNRWAINPVLRSSWIANALINRSLPGVMSEGPVLAPGLGALGAAGANALAR